MALSMAAPGTVPPAIASRHSLRALRLEQIQIWGAAASARSCGNEVAFRSRERRSSLFERDYRNSGTGGRPSGRRTERHSLVRLGGDEEPLDDSDTESIDDQVPRRPKVLRVASIDDEVFPITSTSISVRSQRTYRRPPPTPIQQSTSNDIITSEGPVFIRHVCEDRPNDAIAAAAERRALFAARVKSDSSTGTEIPQGFTSKNELPNLNMDEFGHRSSSFFDEFRSSNATGISEQRNNPFAKAKASIRLLGRYSRTRSARFPILRKRTVSSTSVSN